MGLSSGETARWANAYEVRPAGGLVFLISKRRSYARGTYEYAYA
jgi:hypothetical protein